MGGVTAGLQSALTPVCSIQLAHAHVNEHGLVFVFNGACRHKSGHAGHLLLWCVP